ncbi:MAG: hypothetical protein JW982_14485 [Spirochaetes bacterium]|nr:hypothetical protein [Spirochaetota bacterium]
MKKILAASFLLAALTFISCKSTQPEFSVNDSSIFTDTPVIIISNSRYFLNFSYAEKLCCYSTESKIKNDSLIFFLPAERNSGNPEIKSVYEEITTPEKISLIKSGKVFWEEPDGNLIKLEILRTDKEVTGQSNIGNTH